MSFSSFINNKYVKKVLPPVTYDLISKAVYLKKYKKHQLERKVLQKNISLKDKHKGERCFIVATGPSINNIDLKKLKDEQCIFISRAYLHSDYNHIKPPYHIINTVHDFHPDVVPLAHTWFQEIERRIDKQTTLLLGYPDYEFVCKNGLFAAHNTFYASHKGVQQSTIDFTQPVRGGWSISVMAIEWAIYMGFTEIYMLGIDHDWVLNHFNDRYYVKHFYNEEDCVMERESIKTHTKVDTEGLFYGQYRLWGDYKYMNEYAINHGIKIFNATDGSLLDVLPFKHLPSLFPAVTSSKEKV